MKKMMLIAAMMVAAVSTSAQNEVGQITLKPTVGLNIAKLTKSDDGKVRPGFVAGVEAEYGILENLGITAGVFYSQQGIKAEGSMLNFSLMMSLLLMTSVTSRVKLLSSSTILTYPSSLNIM